MKHKSINRREVLVKGTKKILVPGVVLTVWHKPIVNTVVLPSHGQTSVCTSADALGSWRLEIFDYQEPNIRTITLLEGGTTDTSFIHEWSVSPDGTFSMSQDLNDWRFTGTFSAGCTELSGTYSTINFEDASIDTGTWQATKQ